MQIPASCTHAKTPTIYIYTYIYGGCGCPGTHSTCEAITPYIQTQTKYTHPKRDDARHLVVRHCAARRRVAGGAPEWMKMYKNTWALPILEKRVRIRRRYLKCDFCDDEVDKVRYACSFIHTARSLHTRNISKYYIVYSRTKEFHIYFCIVRVHSPHT